MLKRIKLVNLNVNFFRNVCQVKMSTTTLILNLQQHTTGED